MEIYHYSNDEFMINGHVKILMIFFNIWVNSNIRIHGDSDFERIKIICLLSYITF